MPYFKRRIGKGGAVSYLVQVFAGFGPDGKRIVVTETSKSPSKKAARKVAQGIQDRLDKGTLTPGNQRITMASLLDDVVTDYKVGGKKSVDWHR